uniref:Uncharacterized protein n=1 Tax=Cucumis melo TaxID=3656 RepID=A0A9I9DF27_CUCME
MDANGEDRLAAACLGFTDEECFTIQEFHGVGAGTLDGFGTGGRIWSKVMSSSSVRGRSSQISTWVSQLTQTETRSEAEDVIGECGGDEQRLAEDVVGKFRGKGSDGGDS